MSALAQLWKHAIGRLKEYVRTNPLAQKAIFSASLHVLIISSLLLGSMISCRVRATDNLSPFDLQNFGKPGGGGGGPAAERVAVSKPVSGLEIVKDKPTRSKSDPNKTQPQKTTPVTPRPPSKSDIANILSNTIKDVGPGHSGPGPLGGPPGGKYDPLGWYYSMVRATMYEAWQQPSGLAGTKGLTPRVLIRVQRDGTITQRSLDKSSGNALMDSSVMTAVESVKQLQPLPPGFGSDYKDITIDFELTETPLGE